MLSECCGFKKLEKKLGFDLRSVKSLLD